MPKKISSKPATPLILIIWAFFPFWANASVYINEIMYDLEGNDDKREWVEIYNDSAGEVDLKDWRFNDGSNHILNAPPANGGRGSLVLPALGYALLASDATTTVANYSSYSGIVIDTTMSLGNTSETLKIIDASGAVIDTVSYNSSMGANGDGKTLQKISGSWMAATLTPGAANAGGSSSLASSSLPSLESSSSQNSSDVSSTNSGGGSVLWPDEPQIYANAGKDKIGISGADVLFEGKALGIKKEPIQNARYLWNFGDGASGEGQNIKHVYKYPGNYIVVLDVSSGQYSASDRMDVKIAANELIVSEARNEFIKLRNKSGVTLDISGWFLMGGGVLFKFPESSLVAAGADLIISSDISKIKFNGDDIKVDLLYSNGSVAFSHSQNKKETKPQTVIPTTTTSSSSQANNIAQITQPAKKPEPTTVVGSGTTTQLANVIYSSGENKDGKNYKIWLILAVITGIIGGAGIFLARRFTYTER